MNLKNKVALIATSVLTVGTLVVASPALAHKSGPKPIAKSTAKSVVSPTAIPTPTVSPTATVLEYNPSGFSVTVPAGGYVDIDNI